MPPAMSARQNQRSMPDCNKHLTLLPATQHQSWAVWSWESIYIAFQALTPPLASARVFCVFFVTTCLRRKANMEQIEDEVKSARRQVQLTPVGHPDRVTRLHDLGDKLEQLYNYTDNIEHLDEAISVSSLVTQIPPIDHPRQVWKFNNLASKICLRYLCTKNMDDLDECIKSLGRQSRPP